MDGNDNSKKGKAGKKRVFLPILSALLILCYLAVFIWYFVYGFDSKQEQDETEGAIAVVTDTTPPYTAPSFSPSPTATTGEDIPEVVVSFPPAVEVRGLYIAAWYAGLEDRMAQYIEICDATEINTLVIDVKDDLGQITFITDTEGLSGTSANIIPGIEIIMSTLKEHGVYTIARIVCFKDPVWSRSHPELAIHNLYGDPWEDGNGNTWLDPYNTAAWEYIAAVSREAARIGFDEIQLDYVRFPSDGNLSAINYGAAGAEKSKTEIISDFVAYIRASLAEVGVRLSADIFGIVAISNVDAASIGQDMGLLLYSADYLSPMIYPSHFANKRQNGTGQIINDILFEAPDLEPYEVVYNIMLGVSDHLNEDGGQAIIRPYLQDFTASYLGEGYYQEYTAAQVREQIEAVYEAGFTEWIIWNHWSVYNDDAFEPTNPE